MKKEKSKLQGEKTPDAWYHNEKDDNNKKKGRVIRFRSTNSGG